VGGGTLLGDAKPPGMDICGGIDCPSTCSLSTGSSQARLPGARACPELGYDVES
jgi:hypothetical protein